LVPWSDWYRSKRGLEVFINDGKSIKFKGRWALTISFQYG
jgi:hypothetical protein